MQGMETASQARTAILRRIAKLELELQQARTDLKNLRNHDPTTAEVVTRGARLSGERAGLERQLEMLQVGAIKKTAHAVEVV